jgi:hypothetical protein
MDESSSTITLTIHEKCHKFSAEAEKLIKFVFSKTEFNFQEAVQVANLPEDDVSAVLSHLISEALVKMSDAEDKSCTI